jgi:hypothetical protein
MKNLAKAGKAAERDAVERRLIWVNGVLRAGDMAR